MWLHSFHHTSSVERQVGKERFQIGWPTFWIYLGMIMYDLPFGTFVLVFEDPKRDRCSPFSFVGPKRFTESPVKADLSDWPEDLLPDVVAILGWPWLGMSSPENHGGFTSKDGERFKGKTKGFSQPKMAGWLATLDGAGCNSNLQSKCEVRTLKVVLSLSLFHGLGASWNWSQ